MDWYYSVGGEQKGPVSELDFQRLVQDGIVTGQTLVWRQGMPQWQPYSATNVATSNAPTDPTNQAPASGVICANCGGRFIQNDVITLDGRPYCASCKPMVVQRMREGVTADSAAEETRRKHMSHESSVRSVGGLYVIGGTGVFVLGVLAAVQGMIRNGVEGILFGAFFLVLGAIQIWAGLALRQLKRWARIPTGIFSAIGLIVVFPIGTIINAYILYVLFGAKRAMVFSDEYQTIVQQTPHIKQRTSIVVWIILGVFLLILGTAIFMALVGTS